MTVAIVGHGRLGSAVSKALGDRGVPTRLFSRSTGFDVTRAEPGASFGRVDAVVEATDAPTMSKRGACRFFTSSTRAVNAAARASGASKHILVSIVNCSQPQLQGFGYYAGKAEQERVALAENSGMIIVRSTQWFEFVEQILRRLSIGPLAVVPAMTIQPVALAAVAEVVADFADGTRTGVELDVAGPDVMTLWEMAKAVSGSRRPPMRVPVGIPGKAGRAFRNGTLVPGPGAEVIGPRFADWLAAGRTATGPA